MGLNLTVGMISLRVRDTSDARVVRIAGDAGANVWIGDTCIVADAEAWRALAALATEAANVELDCARVRLAKDESK